MVLYWKRLCALCGSSPLMDESFVFPDLRDTPDLFDIVRMFKVHLKRRCPACPDCVSQLVGIREFGLKCTKTQEMITVCSQSKVHRDEDVIELQIQYCPETAPPAPEPKPEPVSLKDKDLGELSEWLQAKREDCDVHLTEEVVEAKVEDISTTEMMQATYEEVEILPEPEEEVVFQDELVEEVDEDYEEEVDDDNDDEEYILEEVDEKSFKKPRTVKIGVPRKYVKRKKSSRSFKFNQKCSHCPLILHSKHHLTLHEKKHTAKPEVKLTHICEVCGKAFAAPSTLRAHFGVHTDERPFPCDKCEMRFKNAYGLKCHQETHDDKKYICPVCGMSLGTNHTYHAHLKIHSDVRQYKCIVCPKAFKRHTPLKEHLFGHTDLRPYSCPFCPKTFINGSSVRLHKVRLHPRELAELEASGRYAEVLEKHRHLPSLEEIKAIICQKYGIDPNTIKGETSPQEATEIQ